MVIVVWGNMDMINTTEAFQCSVKHMAYAWDVWQTVGVVRVEQWSLSAMLHLLVADAVMLMAAHSLL